MQLETLDHVALVVSDVGRSVAWYRDVLGLTRAHEEDWGDFPAVLQAGGSGVALFPSDESIEPSTFDSLPHVGFRTSRVGWEMAKAELRDRGIAFRESDHGVSWSIYLLDPDRHQIEITTYQPA